MYLFEIYVLFFVGVSFAKDLPSNLPKCFLNDPKLNECVVKAFNEMKTRVSNGIEEIGLPSLNPLFVSELVVLEETPLASFKAIAYNFTVDGLDNYNAKEFEYDSKTMTMRLQISFDLVTMSMTLEINGQVVSIPVIGKGFHRSSYGPMNATIVIKGDIIKLKEIDYYNFKNATVELDIVDGSFYFHNFFQNEKTITSLFNANSEIAAKALTPAIAKMGETGVVTFMKTLTNKFPFNKLLLQSH